MTETVGEGTWAHGVGVLTVEGDEIVNRIRMTKGVFRKQPAGEREERYSISALRAVYRSQFLNGSYGVTLNDGGEVYGGAIGRALNGFPTEQAREGFIAALVARNPALVVGGEAECTAAIAAKEVTKSHVEVVTYKTTRDYEADARRRVAAGWQVSGQSQVTGQTHRIRGATTGAVIGSLLMMPGTGAAIGGLRGKRDPGAITVTWTKSPQTPPVAAAPPAAAFPQPGNLAGELERLAELHRSGALSDEEFAAAKRTILPMAAPPLPPPPPRQ